MDKEVKTTREQQAMYAALDYANAEYRNMMSLAQPDNDFFIRNLAIALGQAFQAGVKWADATKPETS